MSDVATLIADMVRAGVDPEIIGRTAATFAGIEKAAPKTFRQERNARHYQKRTSEKRLNSDERLNSDVSDSVPPKEKSPAPPKEITPSSSRDKSLSQCERDFFSEFWLAFPRREGSNPKKPARMAFLRLVAKGISPETIIAAAQTLAMEHSTPTRFVPQALTWLNQERFDDATPIIPGDTFCPEDNQSTRLHVIRFRNENNGADPPRGVQGGKAGYLIPAGWVKSMQMRMLANG